FLPHGHSVRLLFFIITAPPGSGQAVRPLAEAWLSDESEQKFGKDLDKAGNLWYSPPIRQTNVVDEGGRPWALTWEPRSWPDGLRPTKRLWRRENFPGPPGPIGRRGWTPQRRVSARSSGRRPHPRPSFCAKWPRGSGGRFFPARDGAAPT